MAVVMTSRAHADEATLWLYIGRYHPVSRVIGYSASRVCYSTNVETCLNYFRIILRVEYGKRRSIQDLFLLQ